MSLSLSLSISLPLSLDSGKQYKGQLSHTPLFRTYIPPSETEENKLVTPFTASFFLIRMCSELVPLFSLLYLCCTFLKIILAVKVVLV